GGAVQDKGFNGEKVVEQYVQNSVVPTYKTLDERATTLDSAVETFVNNQTSENLKAAREAWEKTRRPWEQSESWLYGPVASNSYDPQLDSWPVAKQQLDNVLASDKELTREYVAGLNNNKKGFHTIEYLLFGDGGSKKAGDFTDRELDYLKATTAELERIAGKLHTSWTEGVDGSKPYMEVMMKAGSKDSNYESVQTAGQEIVDGMITIVGEVGNGKISDPFKQRDVTKVESQFSHNSLRDFANNIRGVKHAYTSKSLTDSSGSASMSSWVKSNNKELDSKIKSQIDAAIKAIDAVPEPFSKAIKNKTKKGNGREKIQTAMDKLQKLQETLQSELKPMVAGQ
ncbi:MAG: imelysin family protein, partial [Bradymonadaceae bacterium]